MLHNVTPISCVTPKIGVTLCSISIQLELPMQWESLGFRENPFNTEPISQDTLDLYTGHGEEMAVCLDILEQKDVLVIVEGARGVGTTSFANYLRFSLQAKKTYFTPRNEIRVEPNWNLETLLAVIISNIVREIEFFQSDKIIKDKRFQDAKALSLRIAEAYRSFGIDVFGFGINYGKSGGTTSQPIIVPSSVLGHHLEDLALLIQSIGYRYGILIQLNNLDVGAIHEETHLRYLFNALRDYIQTRGISWLMVGDVGLRRFIAQQVDRLDDIVTYETEINPINKQEYECLINKRLDYYRVNQKVISPIEQDVFAYLHLITHGRLRYIFGLLQRLLGRLHVGDLTNKLTLDIAKPMIAKLAHERITRNKLSPGEELILSQLVLLKEASTSEIAKETGKSVNYISNVLANLIKMKLATAQKKGKNRYYVPELDAIIAYSK